MSDTVGVARMLAAQVALLDHVLQPAPADPQPASAARSPAMSRALAHIDEHADLDLDLAEIAAVADGTTVAQVAARHHFAHAGRFSADHRRAFGTSPRHTLPAGGDRT